MATTELAIRLSVQGAGQVQATLAGIVRQMEQLRQSVPRLARAASELGEELTTVGAATFAFVQTFSRLSGIGAASQLETLRNQLTVLVGNTEQARALADALYELGAQTRFNTAEVAMFGSALLASGTSVEQLQSELAGLLDLIAAMGVAREDIGRVLENFVQIRTMGVGEGNLQDIRQMFRAMPGIGRALGMSLGREPLSAREATELLRQIGGEEFFRLLLRAGQQFEGASRSLTIGDTLSNLAETFGQVLVPTGELFGAILRALVPILSAIASGLRTVNSALGGIPGALFALAASALAASAALRILERAGIAAAFTQTIGLVRGLGGALAALGRWLWAFLRTAGLRVGLAGLIIGLFSELIGAISDAFEFGRFGNAIRTVGTGAGIGAAVGGAIGSVVPALGTALGIVAGGTLGAIGGLIRLITGREDTRRAADAQQQTAQNTARMARALDDMRIQMIGGGEHTRSALSRYEVEAYLRRLAGSGI